MGNKTAKKAIVSGKRLPTVILLTAVCVLSACGVSGLSRNCNTKACAAGGQDGAAVIDVTGEDLSYAVFGAVKYNNCIITGFSPEWLAGHPADPQNKLNLSIKIPAVWENEGTVYKVKRISENAFRCGYEVLAQSAGLTIVDYISDYSIVSVDFSEASNLATIDKSAFRETDIEEVDLSHTTVLTIGESAFSACGRLRRVNPGVSLESIGKYAFSGCAALEVIDLRLISLWDEVAEGAFYFCDSLKTVYLGSEFTVMGGMFTFPDRKLPDFGEYLFSDGNVENIVFYDERCMDEALKDNNLKKYSYYFTYEQEIIFDPNGGSAEKCVQAKLFNRSLDYVKRDNGAWERDPEYKLPSPGVMQNYVYRWAGAESGAEIHVNGSVAESVYLAVWTYALTARLELPAGFILHTDKTPAVLAPYITAEFAVDGHTSLKVTDFTLSYGQGADSFAEGENKVTVSYGGCSVMITVIAELPPPAVSGKLPPFAYGLIAAGAFLAFCAFAAILYGFKKKGIFVREKTVEVVKTETVTETVEVVKEIPISGGQPLPMKMFTPAEKRVAELLLLGKSRREIADELDIAENTARNHTVNILGKAEVNSQKAFISKYIYDKHFFEEE